VGKIAIWILLGLAVMLLLRLFGSAKRRVRDDTDREDPSAGGARRGGPRTDRERTDNGSASGNELILACAVCGVHVPSSDALFARGRVYCCAEHRDADAAAPPPGPGGGG